MRSNLETFREPIAVSLTYAQNITIELLYGPLGEVNGLRYRVIRCPFSLNLGRVMCADLRCPRLVENHLDSDSHFMWGNWPFRPAGALVSVSVFAGSVV